MNHMYMNVLLGFHSLQAAGQSNKNHVVETDILTKHYGQALYREAINFAYG